MEQIQRPDTRPWISSQLINAGQFLKQCEDENVAEVLGQAGLTFEAFTKKRNAAAAASRCDVETLTCDGEEQMLQGKIFKPNDWLSDVQLESVKYLRDHAATKYWSVDYSVKESDPSPLRNVQPAAKPDPQAVSSPSSLEAIIVVQIFKPTNPAVKRSPLSLDMEIEVMASQVLQDLRQAIGCPSDMIRAPHLQNLSKTSAYFFINDTFYNDSRPTSIDYSEPIIEWSKTQAAGIGDLKAEDMAVTRFADISFRLGYPYLYVHQGDCEHLIVFKDMRVVLSSKISPYDYPKLKPIAKRLQVKCELCCVNVACWTTRDNERTVTDPSFFCEECHRSFNYNSSGEKVGNFTEQEYVDKSVLF